MILSEYMIPRKLNRQKHPAYLLKNRAMMFTADTINRKMKSGMLSVVLAARKDTTKIIWARLRPAARILNIFLVIFFNYFLSSSKMNSSPIVVFSALATS